MHWGQCPSLGRGGWPASCAPTHPSQPATPSNPPAWPARVAVLDGGLPAWKAAGGEVETTPVEDAAIHAAAEALRSPPASCK